MFGGCIGCPLFFWEFDLREGGLDIGWGGGRIYYIRESCVGVIHW